MATFSQLRGMLLEEAILYLLRHSGYKTIESIDGDETLDNHSAGLAVKGRGGRHQIDAIADFMVTPPFSHPQRLLLEAKCYNKSVGIEVIRNAFGVVRDVEEFWVSSPDLSIWKKRYHYHYAIASISGFSKDAQRYAYVHDIYLLALERASYFQSVVHAINAFYDGNEEIDIPRTTGWLHELRTMVRERLRDGQTNQPALGENMTLLLNEYFSACQAVGSGVMALLNGRFPVMFIPAPDLQLNRIQDQKVRIFRGEENRGWFISTQNRKNKLFSFDIPQELFELYANGGELTRENALNLKADNLGIIQLIIISRWGRVRVVVLKLDDEWINQLRQG